MKKILSVLLLLTTLVGFSQTPVSWQVNSKSIDENTYEVKIEADLEPGWHLYSQFLESDEGPLSTYITYEANNFELIGKTEEKGVETHMDPVWEMDISFFADHATFIQVVKSLNPDSLILKGNVNFMICNDTECLPPENYSFQVNLSGGEEIIEEVVYKTDSAALSIIPTPSNLDLDNPIIENCEEDLKTETTENLKKEDEKEEKKGAWMLFLLGLGGGLISLITPCVFPMIPLTVSFFTKGGSEKGKGVAKAILYGVSIVAVYASLSIPFYFSGTDPEVLNQISTSPTLNIIFFVIFIVFAISFLGYYELSLPSSWANKADKAADLGGFFGVIFMALVLAIVSFSCTGPLLGSVLAGSLKDGPVPITMAMLGFGVGLGLPFTLFAAFPSLLKSLPSSGGWLNTVKVVLGFIELGLALKFLSNADFVFQAGIVLRETFFLIWAILAFLTSLYLLGFINFPHDSKGVKISISRKIISVIFLSFAIYLSPGVLPEKSQPWSHSLVSGFPPPFWYGWYADDASEIEGILLDIKDENLNAEASKISDIDILIDFIESHNTIAFEAEDELNGIDANSSEGKLLQKTIDENTIHYHITDYYLGLHYSQTVNRPMLLDFTGYACVNCRKMEENVWTNHEVKETLERKYIVISLYVDDKNKLAEDVRGKSVTINLSDGTTKQKKLITIGDRWSTFETLRFAQVSQPYYVLMSPDEYLLNTPVPYTPDATEYSNWLDCGLSAFDKLKAGDVDLSEIEGGKDVVAENVDPVTWNFSTNKISDTETELVLLGDIAEGWHTYSQYLESMDGPLPTWITFEESDNYELIDSTREEGSHSHFDDTFEMDIVDFSGKATFLQSIKVKSTESFTIKGNINFMVCENGRCLPPKDEPFEITINP